MKLENIEKIEHKVHLLFCLVDRCITYYEYSITHLEEQKLRLDYVESSYCTGKIDGIKGFLIDLNMVLSDLRELSDLTKQLTKKEV